MTVQVPLPVPRPIADLPTPIELTPADQARCQAFMEQGRASKRELVAWWLLAWRFGLREVAS